MNPRQLALLAAGTVAVVALGAYGSLRYFENRARLREIEQLVKSAPGELPVRPAELPVPATPLREDAAIRPLTGQGQPLPPKLAARVQGTGMMIDATTGRILWARNENESVPIASMTKMMTVLVTFELLAQAKDKGLDTNIRVSPAAMRIGGSQVWLEAGSEYTVAELLPAVMIHSANDAAYALAEGVSPDGKMDTFIKLMNERAAALGMTNSAFRNVHGLPEKEAGQDSRASAHDLVILGQELLRYPLARELSGTAKASFKHKNGKEMELTNRDGLVVSGCPGVFGLKTGYIARAGFCVTSVCEREGRRIIAVVTGYPRKEDRDSFVSDLLNWGYTLPGDK